MRSWGCALPVYKRPNTIEIGEGMSIFEPVNSTSSSSLPAFLTQQGNDTGDEPAGDSAVDRQIL